MSVQPSGLCQLSTITVLGTQLSQYWYQSQFKVLISGQVFQINYISNWWSNLYTNLTTNQIWILCLSLKISTETIKFLGIKIFQKSKLSKNVMIKNCSLIIIILIQKKIFFERFMPVKIDIENQNFAILSGSFDLRKKNLTILLTSKKDIFQFSGLLKFWRNKRIR